MADKNISDGIKLNNSINLPIVNYGNVVDSTCCSPESRQIEASKLVDAFTKYGFAIVENIKGYNEEELFQWTKWFYYDVTPEERFNQLAIHEFNSNNPNVYRGLFPLIEGKVSYKESYDMGEDFSTESEEERIGRADNPLMCDTPRLVLEGDRQAQAEKFYKVMYYHREILRKVADNLMSMIAEAGGERQDFFEDMFNPCPLHTLRTNMYPVRKNNIPEMAYLPEERIISTPAHQDFGVLTLLQTFGQPGLEIQLDNEWFSIQVQQFPKPGGTLIVNMGEQLSVMSNKRFKATIHRVLDIGRDRFSMPYFYEPSLDACINRKIPKSLLLSEDKNHSTDNISYGSFLLNKLPTYSEWSKLLDMLPKSVHDKYLGQQKIKLINWASRNGIKIYGMFHDDKIAQTSVSAT